MKSLRIDQVITEANFDEEAYLTGNPDVARAVAASLLASGRQHFDRHGHKESRRGRLTAGIAELRRTKLARLAPAFRQDMPHQVRDGKYDFLTAELRQKGRIVDTDLVSACHYSDDLQHLIARYHEGLILDCGAGLRDVYYENVVNFEIVDYDTTDVLGLGEHLPFKDNVFDAAISIAMLEHVRDPFACAAEIARVLKPGGMLWCSAPFMVPLHGYPNHYYNMTVQGIRALFEDRLIVDNVSVEPDGLPIWSLAWILRSWAEGLPEPVRAEFLALKVGDLTGDALQYIDCAWVTQLSLEKNRELAAASLLLAHKAG